ncbi:tRNA synthetases class I-domain-containing protein, partial [Blyttiomyces helicus]
MASTPIPDIPAHISFPDEEKKILEFWAEIDAFQTSMELAEGKPRFSFYDGPPFATGLPHYGHLLAGTIKDVVCRFAAQTGHHVERRFGWDTHGLPIEHIIDKKLNIKGPNDVAAFGVDKYNEECRAIVMKYAAEWETTVTRMGRWIDFKNDYKTLNLSYMESVWWVFKQLYVKNQVYRGFRILPYSNGVCTPLSNFEAGENYKDVTDPAVVISFPLKSDPSVSFLAWTTTPWTLPSNLALCVHPEFDYIKIEDGETKAVWILAESRLDILYKDPKKAKFTVLAKMKGADLKGMKYEPLYDFYSKGRENAFAVLTDKYVTADGGTGIVHQSPGFGEDDYRVCTAHGVVTGEGDLPNPLDASGNFTAEVPDYVGLYIKDADKVIQKDLKAKGRLIRQTQFSHSYPFCWRSDTPLIQKAVPGWFIRVANIADQLVANNKQTHWVPGFIKENKFHNWLENARDWNVSRNRYWGTPIPLWVSEDYEEIVAIGSVEELRELSGCGEITDLHRHNIDHITIPSKTGKGVLRRVTEVFDCWFESGSMPYAQQHYPFENKEKFEATFPANFIAEGTDQTRGWFYTLMVLSTHLFQKPPFQNVVVNGIILASDGKKMSKRLANYPDPTVMIDKHGADVLRLYLVTSPAVRAETLRFNQDSVRELVAQAFLPWYNAYRFFFSQLQLMKKEHNIDFIYNPAMDLHGDQNVMDRWILASTQTLIGYVRREMEAYRLYTVTPELLKLIDSLTNWYVRFNRKRLKGENGPEDAIKALNVLFEVLLTLARLMAPFTPFISESMYQNLRKFLPASAANAGADVRSIHFIDYPEVKADYFNDEVERAVSRMQTVIELGRYIREQKAISLKNFIAEGTDQTRGWFYTLMVLSTHLFQKPPFQNVVVNGIILASDGKKMSKRLANYPDPTVMIDKHGADVLRLYLVTSPAVRAETLRFNQDSVRELVAQAFLPWYNAYRFFFSQLQLMKKEHNIDFIYNPAMDLHGDQNVMDRWILASTQTLIGYVRREMEAYRLYTVTPELLKLIDSLTNWYVRFNRKRLKGENGPEDAIKALNVLFEVLLTLARLMAPFTPFISESMYQNLRKFLPASAANAGADVRSIHFIDYPEVKADYFNDEVERAVSRMQTVIELGRYIREQKAISLKTPCRELIIISPDPQYHADIKSLESYIVEELNIRTVTLTSEEEKFGVKYRFVPDSKAIGLKLRKEAAKVRTALPQVSQEEIKKFMETKTVTVAGQVLGEAELSVARYFDNAHETYVAHFTNDVLVILDTEMDRELVSEGTAREIINRVQRLRKK